MDEFNKQRIALAKELGANEVSALQTGVNAVKEQVTVVQNEFDALSRDDIIKELEILQTFLGYANRKIQEITNKLEQE